MNPTLQANPDLQAELVDGTLHGPLEELVVVATLRLAGLVLLGDSELNLGASTENSILAQKLRGFRGVRTFEFRKQGARAVKVAESI